jgi:hypothetical protein
VRRLAATLVALATLAVPAVAGAGAYDGCAQGGCTSSADVIRCWWPQSRGWTPAPVDVRPARQRADGTWELAIDTDRFHQGSRCVEILGMWVYVDDVPAVVAYLKARALADGQAVELEGELVAATLDLPWFLCIHSHEASGWHNHRDGGLQIIPSTWRAYGGREFAPYAGDATIEEQLEVGRRVLTGGGESQWTTWRRCA